MEAVVIVGSPIPKKIGSQTSIAWADKDVWNQPVVIIKETTFAEYVEFVQSVDPNRTYESIKENCDRFGKKYFYEVSTD